MNDSVDRSLILPDEFQHIVTPIRIKVALAKKLVILMAVITILLLIGTFYFAFAPVAPKEVLDQNKRLKQLSIELKTKSKQLAQILVQQKDLNRKLVVQNESLSNQLQQNNDFVAYLQKDIQLNCNPEKQRLRFNMTSMNAFTLSVLNTGSLGGIPEITFLNASGDQLSSFSDNSLPSLEYVDLTDNPITKISNNKLDKVVDFVGVTSQTLLNEFASNYIPMVKSLNLSHSNISVFKNNTISGVQNLDISDNKLKSFSNFNLATLERLNISANPITEFSMNNFTNLVEFSSLFLVGAADSILLNDSYFGKVKNMQLRSKSTSYPPPFFTFQNNYFPSLTNLTLNYFTIYFQSLKSNGMAELTDIKFLSCSFTGDIQYLQEWSSLHSMMYVRSNFKNFSGHSYPSMMRLHLNQSNVQEFANNYLPVLEELILYDRSTSTTLSIRNNDLSNLKTLVFSVPTTSDMSWIKSLRELQYLELTDLKVDTFDGYSLRELRTLKLTSNSIASFKNNFLPSLKELVISDLLTPFDDTMVQGRLERLSLTGRQETFDNFSFSSLKYLYLSSFTSCTFANNSFPLLEELWVQNTGFAESNNLPALKRFFFLGKATDFSLPHKYEGTIETLVFIGTYVDSFEKYNMPQLREIRITISTLASFTQNKFPKATVIYLKDNFLNKFECEGFPAVQELDLSGNELSDDIVKTLIDCKFTDLISLSLKENQIKDMDDARKKLGSAYPKATIVL